MRKPSHGESTATPLIDRPDFSQLLASGQFGPWSEQAAQMHTEGFCVLEIEDLVSGPDCQDLIDQLQTRMAVELEDWEAGRAGAPRLQDGWRQLPAARSLALQPQVLSLLRHLYGREPFAFQTLNFPVGSEQTFHSDAVHFHAEPQGFMCGVWIPLADVEPDSGPLIYYPGSHRLPYRSAASLGLTPAQVSAEPHPQRFFEPGWHDDVARLGLEPQLFLPCRGQVLIWHANLLHGGSPVANRQARRWSQVVHYYFADCLYTTPMQSFSREQGGIAYRNPVDVKTGRHIWSAPEWSKMNLTASPALMQSPNTTPKRTMSPQSWLRRLLPQANKEDPSLKGNLEVITPSLITGWIHHPGVPLSEVRLLSGSQLIAMAFITDERPDVGSMLGLPGPFGFQLQIPDQRPELDPSQPLRVLALTSDGTSRFTLQLPGLSSAVNESRLRAALAPDLCGLRGHFDGLSPDGSELTGWCYSSISGQASVWLHAEGLPPRNVPCWQHRPSLAVEGHPQDCGFAVALSDWPQVAGRNVWASFDEAGVLQLPPLVMLKVPLPRAGQRTEINSEVALQHVSEGTLTEIAEVEHYPTDMDSNLQEHWQALEEFRSLIDRLEVQVQQQEALAYEESRAQLPPPLPPRRRSALFRLWR